MAEKIIFAIPKGRILDEALPLMRAVGIEPEPAFFDDSSRALMFATGNPAINIIRVRAFDVASFVAHGAAHRARGLQRIRRRRKGSGGRYRHPARRRGPGRGACQHIP